MDRGEIEAPFRSLFRSLHRVLTWTHSEIQMMPTVGCSNSVLYIYVLYVLYVLYVTYVTYMFYIPTIHSYHVFPLYIYNTYCTPLIFSSPHKIVAFMSYPIHFMY